jgi:predicted carbohydrate-binding protein with CBM5 and CBM33 domain
MKRIILFALTLLSSSYVFAHGYVLNPPSRALLCSSRNGTEGFTRNRDCGEAATWGDTQSMEGLGGFPERGVPDGQIASAGPIRAGNHNLDFQRLNEQTSTRWTRVPMQSGQRTFQWFVAVPHRTLNWQFFITQPNWNPNQPLTRASFEAQPFCQQLIPPPFPQPPLGAQLPISCNVPQRTGYQIILAIWTIQDTPMAFYNVIDADFSAGSTTPPPVNPPPTNPPPVNPPPVVTPPPVNPPPGNVHRIDRQQQVNAIDSGASDNPNPNGINNFRNLLQANQNVEIFMTPNMWLHRLVFPAANQVPANRTILFSNRITWNLTVTLNINSNPNENDDRFTIPNGRDVRFVVRNGRWVPQ